MRDDPRQPGDKADSLNRYPPQAAPDHYHLTVTLAGNTFDAHGTWPGDGLTLLFQAWLNAQPATAQLASLSTRLGTSTKDLAAATKTAQSDLPPT